MPETNIIHSLKIKCAAAGTNLTEVCRMVNVSRQNLEMWKKKEPKTIQTLRKIELAIEEKRKQLEKK
jgi:hypothetical protein